MLVNFFRTNVILCLSEFVFDDLSNSWKWHFQFETISLSHRLTSCRFLAISFTVLGGAPSIRTRAEIKWRMKSFISDWIFFHFWWLLLRWSLGKLLQNGTSSRFAKFKGILFFKTIHYRISVPGTEYAHYSLIRANNFATQNLPWRLNVVTDHKIVPSLCCAFWWRICIISNLTSNRQLYSCLAVFVRARLLS